MVKVVGRRKMREEAAQFGFEHLQGFLAAMNRLRAVDVVRPKGVYRFKSLEEANAWWQETATPRFRGRRTSKT